MGAMSEKLVRDQLYFGGTFVSAITKGVVELLPGYELSSSNSSSLSESSSSSSDSSSSSSSDSSSSSFSSYSSSSSNSFLSSSSVHLHTDLYVSPTGNDSNDGDSPLNAKLTVQNAVDNCYPGRTVYVLSGTYLLSSTIVVNKGITISGESPFSTIIDGNNSTVCMLVNHPDAVVEKLTIQHGKCITWGPAGVGISGTVRYCVIQNNVLIFGGAESGYGGAGVTIGYGGRLLDCLVINNTSYTFGGGASMVEGGRIENCTFYNNITAYGAGGIITLTWYDAIITICNTIAYGNTGEDIESGVGSYIGINNYVLDPLFTNSLGGDFSLQSGSVCINAGDDSLVTVPYDLNGNTRIQSSHVDIGAYERTL